MFRILLVSALVALSMGAVPRAMRPMLDGRIVGGQNAKIEDHPYQLSLERNGRHTCGASILTKNRAVTAAHCTSGSQPSPFRVRAGSTDRGSGGQLRQVLKIFVNPKYNPSTIDYDVSVLAIEDLTFGVGVQPIPLHPANAVVKDGTHGTISGWGTLSSGGALPTILQVVTVPKVSDAYCRSRYGTTAITSRMTCHGYEQGGKDSCQGDSGGPNVADGYLVGIVSWGRGCATAGYPGVYTKVANQEINDFIHFYL